MAIKKRHLYFSICFVIMSYMLWGYVVTHKEFFPASQRYCVYNVPRNAHNIKPVGKEKRFIRLKAPECIVEYSISQDRGIAKKVELVSRERLCDNVHNVAYINDLSQISFWENLKIQYYFEKEVLQGLGDYRKDYIQGFLTAYATFFYHYQIVFLAIVLLIYILYVYYKYKKKHEGEIYVGNGPIFMPYKAAKLLLSFVILLTICSYILWGHVVSHKGTQSSRQKYYMYDTDSTDFARAFLELCKSNTSYVRFQEPFHGRYIAVRKYEIHIKEVACKMEFIVRKRNKGVDVELCSCTRSFNEKNKVKDMQFNINDASRISLNENLRIQSTFEKEVLAKIGNYQKDRKGGLLFWYTTFFFHYQLVFLGIIGLLVWRMSKGKSQG